MDLFYICRSPTGKNRAELISDPDTSMICKPDGILAESLKSKGPLPRLDPLRDLAEKTQNAPGKFG